MLKSVFIVLGKDVPDLSCWEDVDLGSYRQESLQEYDCKLQQRYISGETKINALERTISDTPKGKFELRPQVASQVAAF